MIAALVVAAGLALAGWAETPAAYPEGPLITPDALYVPEMGEDRVRRFTGPGPEPGAGEAWFTARGCGPTAIAPYGDGFAVLCHLGDALALVDAGGHIRVLRDPAPGRPNDASADGQGGVYFSSPGGFYRGAPADGALRWLGPDGAVRTVAAELFYPNGVFVDRAEGALYVSEHLARRIWRYPIVSPGVLGARTLFADLDALNLPTPPAPPYAEAGPDGLERAPNGDLVVAIYGERRLLQFTSDGRLRKIHPAPARFVTNIAFAADGSAIVVGAHDNANPPYPGVIARLPPAAFAE